MAIYKIKNDYKNYWSFSIDGVELFKKMGGGFNPRFDATSRKDEWVQPEAEFFPDDQFYNKKTVAIPDLSVWVIGNLVLNQKAYDTLAQSMLPYGEFLSVQCESIPYYLFNTLNIINDNAIDKTGSEQDISNGVYMGTGSLKFVEDNISDSLLFKTNFDKLAATFCTEEFKTLVNDSGLSGLIFESDLALY